MKNTKRSTLTFIYLIFTCFGFPYLFLVAVAKRFKNKSTEISITWGSEPLLNYKYWSSALTEIGINSRTVTQSESKICNSRDFDKILFPPPTSKLFALGTVKYVLSKLIIATNELSKIIWKSNIVGSSLNGSLLSHFNRGLYTYRYENILFRIADVKTFVIPMGSEAWIYNRLKNPNWLYGLITDYPGQARMQRKIAKRVDYLVEKSDYFLPGLGILDGFGRSDKIYPNPICIDTDRWSPSGRHDNQKKKITVTHTPNHHFVKGTSFISQAIKCLQAEGFEIDYLLIENTLNSELHGILRDKSDIHIDQLNSDGYALSALEAMSLGICTLSSFEGPVRKFYDDWSFTQTCPIISINKITLVDILREVLTDEGRRIDTGRRSREYVLEHHSYRSFQNLFLNVISRDFDTSMYFKNMEDRI